MFLTGLTPFPRPSVDVLIHISPSFSSALAALSAPVTVVIQRAQSAAREIRIKPDSSPHPEFVIQFFEGLGQAASEQRDGTEAADPPESAAADMEPYASAAGTRRFLFVKLWHCRYMDDDDEKFWDAVDSLDDIAATAAPAEPPPKHSYERTRMQPGLNM